MRRRKVKNLEQINQCLCPRTRYRRYVHYLQILGSIRFCCQQLDTHLLLSARGLLG